MKNDLAREWYELARTNSYKLIGCDEHPMPLGDIEFQHMDGWNLISIIQVGKTYEHYFIRVI